MGRRGGERWEVKGRRWEVDSGGKEDTTCMPKPGAGRQKPEKIVDIRMIYF